MRNPRYCVTIGFAYDKVNVGVSKEIVTPYENLSQIMMAFDPMKADEMMSEFKGMPRNRVTTISQKSVDENGNIYYKVIKVRRN